MNGQTNGQIVVLLSRQLQLDLVFGSNSELRARLRFMAEVYDCSDSGGKFVHDFVAAGSKLMDPDRFDVATAASLHVTNVISKQ